jgi:hypothetical protein
MTGTALVSKVQRRFSRTIRRAAKYPVVDEQRLRGRKQRQGCLSQSLLGLHRRFESFEERVLVARQGGQHCSAVRPASDALPLELGKIAARGHWRDPELLLERRDRDAPVLAQTLRD